MVLLAGKGKEFPYEGDLTLRDRCFLDEIEQKEAGL